MDILRSHSSDSNFDTKHCHGCDRDLPATLQYFSPQKQNKGGLASQCKQCNAARTAKYRKENAEKVKAYEEVYNASDARKIVKARYRATHRDQIKIEKDKWHAEHREEQRQYCAEYNATHHDERLRYGRQRYAEHRKEMNAQARQYRCTDHGRMMHRAQENKRHARKRQVEGTLTVEQIQEKLRLQHYQCYYTACGHMPFEKRNGRYIFHLEHTIPVSRTEYNPRHDINYVVLACPSCNLKKNNKLPHEFFEGGRLL